MRSDAMDKMAASEEIYEVEHIIGKRKTRRGIEYLIRWKTYDSSWDTWEPVANLGDAMDIVEEFNDRIALDQIMGIKPKTSPSGVKRAAGGTAGPGSKAAEGTTSPPAKKQNAKTNKSPNRSPKSQAATAEVVAVNKTPDVTKTKSPKKKKSAVKAAKTKGEASTSGTPVKEEKESEVEESDSIKVEKSTAKPTTKSVPKGSKKQTKAASAKVNQKTGKAKLVSTKAVKNSNASKAAVSKANAKQGTVKKTKAAGSKTKSKVPKNAGTNSVLSEDKDVTNPDSIASTEIIKPKKSVKTQKGKSTAKAQKSGASEQSSKKQQQQTKKNGKSVKRKKPSVMDTPSDASTDDDDDILYSINEDAVSFPKKKKRQKTVLSDISDPDISFQKVVSPNKKILLKDSMKTKTKIVKPVPRMPVSPSRVRSPIFLNEVPVSPYKTPPSSPSSISPATHHLAASLPAHGREAPQGKDFFLSDLPTVPVIPVIPSSPSAASYKKVLAKSYPPDTQKLYANHAGESSDEEDSEEGAERRISVRQSECTFRYKEIVVRKCQGYTQVWLFTQTKIKNCLNPAVLSELRQVLQNAKYDDSRLVMISGSGSIFCSGVDLHYLQNGNRKQAADNMAEAIREFMSAVISFPKLIVAAVNGPAIGLGVSILPLFDIIYASDKASFYCPYARLAQTPEACASYTFSSIMGNAMANEMLLGGRKLTAIEAYQIGIVSQVFWPTSMMQQVMPRVQNLVMYSAKALEQSKMLIRSHQKPKLEFTNESECRMLSERWSTAECHKAIKDYLEDEQDILV